MACCISRISRQLPALVGATQGVVPPNDSVREWNSCNAPKEGVDGAQIGDGECLHGEGACSPMCINLSGTLMRLAAGGLGHQEVQT